MDEGNSKASKKASNENHPRTKDTNPTVTTKYGEKSGGSFDMITNYKIPLATTIILLSPEDLEKLKKTNPS